MKSRLSKSSFNIRNGQLVSHDTHENGLTTNESSSNGSPFNLSSIGRLNQESINQTFFRDQNASPFHPSRPSFDGSPHSTNSKLNAARLDSPFANSQPNSQFGSPFNNNFKSPISSKLDRTNRTPLSDYGKVRFNQSTFNIQDDLNQLLNQEKIKSLNKQNSKSVVSLHSNAVKCLSTPSNKSRQVTKRKNSVNIRQILFDRLTNATSKSNGSIANHISKSSKSTNSINQPISQSPFDRFHTPSSENIDDFFEFSSSNLAVETPIVNIVNNPQLELKLSQIRKAKSGSQSIFDLRRNQQPYESNHSFNSTNTTNSTTAVCSSTKPSYAKTNSTTEVDSAAAGRTSFQRVAKLKTQNATRFKELLNNNKKFSQSLNDLSELAMINSTDDLNWKEFGDAYQNEIR